MQNYEEHQRQLADRIVELQRQRLKLTNEVAGIDREISATQAKREAPMPIPGAAAVQQPHLVSLAKPPWRDEARPGDYLVAGDGADALVAQIRASGVPGRVLIVTEDCRHEACTAGHALPCI